MSAEKDSVHIPNFPLVPVRTVEKTSDRWDGTDFIGIGLDPDSRLMSYR